MGTAGEEIDICGQRETFYCRKLSVIDLMRNEIVCFLLFVIGNDPP